MLCQRLKKKTSIWPDKNTLIIFIKAGFDGYQARDLVEFLYSEVFKKMQFQSSICRG